MILAELEKYERMHRVPGYSLGPGASYVSHLLPYLNPGDTIIDFGCGSGDAAKMLTDLGYAVTLVDITAAGLNPAHGLYNRFVQASLHALPPEVPEAPWGFCTDTMEHLPEEWVGLALQEMRTRVPNILFSISGTPDGWGKYIGEILHLTVKPRDWWEEQIGRHWKRVDRLNESDTVYEFIGRA